MIVALCYFILTTSLYPNEHLKVTKTTKNTVKGTINIGLIVIKILKSYISYAFAQKLARLLYFHNKIVIEKVACVNNITNAFDNFLLKPRPLDSIVLIVSLLSRLLPLHLSKIFAVHLHEQFSLVIENLS